MADDAGVLQQPLDIRFGERGDAVEIEAVEGLAEILALAQDGQPRQAGLETFEADLLEQPDVVGDRAAPLMVVIMAVEFVLARPGAAQRAVQPGDQPGVLLFPSIRSWRLQLFTGPLPNS